MCSADTGFTEVLTRPRRVLIFCMQTPSHQQRRLAFHKSFCATLTVGTLVALALGTSSGTTLAGEASDSPSAGVSSENGAAVKSGEKTASATSAGKDSSRRGLVIEGEKFTARVVKDTQQGGLAVCVFQAPEKWHDESRTVWRYDYTSNPVAIWCSVENPDNEEAFYSFPPVLYFWLRPATQYYRPGQNSGGLICGPPMAPLQTLLAFVQQVRGTMPGLQLVGSKALPDLAKVLKLKSSPNQQGVGLKVTYELKGKAVEEEFYAVADSVDIPYDGPQGRTWQINWGLTAVHSFRAPKGAMDRRRAIFAAMVKSVRINPAWEQRRAAIQNYLTEQFNQQLQAGYDAIAAAGRLSRQISANNDAMLASIDHQLQASRTQSSAAAGRTRSSTDNFDDYIRGVETVDDPYWGTSQHSINEQYHWTDGYGNYRNSNDAGFNPNHVENGDWQLMQPTR